MRVAIAGAHGGIALRLAGLLVARGDEVDGLIRNPDHAGELEELGVAPVVCDLELADVHQIAAAVKQADAVVFAAGAGAGSGAARKLTMDRDGAIKLLQATEATGARYVIVSSVGAETRPEGDEGFDVYLRAKHDADEAVKASEDREWMILRPGRLTDESGTGMVRLDAEPFRGEVPRDDVAAAIAAVLADSRATHQVLYINGGDTPVDQALAAALGK
jgi:nucleoside-diphosphate-sugar epimerase